MGANKDYYAVLGVLPTAEDAVIRAAYKALAQRYHPDRNASESAKSRMQEINEAYSVLSDPEARAQYDSARSASKDADYEEFEDDTESSEQQDAQLDQRWLVALDYYPEIDEYRKRLSKVSSRLAYTYQAYLIEEKVFEKAEKIYKLMQDQFLAAYFGDSKEIKAFAMKLIFNGEKKAARELNRAIKILGSDASPNRVIQKIRTDFDLGAQYDIRWGRNVDDFNRQQAQERRKKQLEEEYKEERKRADRQNQDSDAKKESELEQGREKHSRKSTSPYTIGFAWIWVTLFLTGVIWLASR